MSKSKFVTAEMIEEIFQEQCADLTKRYITNVPGRTAAVIIVLDPVITVDSGLDPQVLWRGTLGEQEETKWPHKYSEFAFAKARAAWRTKMSNIDMFKKPALICEGDFRFPGGVYFNNLVTAISGFKTGDDDHIAAETFAIQINAKAGALFKAFLENSPPLFF
ncbi:MAG TPA: hypothetical protein VL335_01660 [Candidatus Paceibacterota bacterium]|jgi:hypothetical protein|nr:hypothetical protein [Candidatus Paceibacterota bacterium]